MRSIAFALALGALVSGCLRNWDGYGRELGEPCSRDADCTSGACDEVCIQRCDELTGCVPGWMCGAGGACTCSGGGAESCDGRDQDCDGLIDEGSVCGCGGAETCNMIDDDCDGRIDEAGCGSCAPRVEGCNGIDDDCDGVVDDELSAALCRPGFECSAGVCRCSADVRPAADELDLLLMVDNSNSMSEEQASLAVELPRMMRILASGDRDADGVREFVPPRSIHVGVITSDMGTGNFAVPTCDRGTFGHRYGDDGILRTRGRTAIPGCMATYPSIFEFAPGAGGDPTSFAEDLSCVATAGTGGCGFEQQLEAVLKAVSPSSPQDWTIPAYSPPIFFESTLGHANVENNGFLRPNSALAIMMITDEEDCSVANPEVFDMASTQFPGDLNLRCFMYGAEVQHPVERYVRGTDGRSGLLGVRARPDRLIFSLLAGIPADVVGDGRNPDYDTILAHRDMQEQIDPSAPPTAPRLRPSCSAPGGTAMPPRRMVRVAQELERGGARVSVGSICQASYADPMNALLDDVAESFSAPAPCE